MVISTFWLRTLGFIALIGGLVLFAGDMLFYYDGASTDLKLNMANASDSRIKLSGISALFASWFYLLGLIPIYIAFKKSSRLNRNAIVISFGAILVAYGVIHGAYVAIAISSKLALQNHMDIEQATQLAVDTNQLIRLFIYPIFAVLSFIFIKEVWKKNSLYPRWIIVFFPLIPFLLQGVLSKVLIGSTRVIVLGGYLNLILVLFFTASTIALWRVDDENL